MMNHELEFTHVDLYAGIGGFSLAFEAEGFRTIAYAETNPDKCLVYDHWFPGVRNIGDVRAIRHCLVQKHQAELAARTHISESTE